MNKTDYLNPLGNQVISLPGLVDEQLKRCFDKERLQNLLSVPEIFDIRKIYISGAGDSIAAAGAMADVLLNCTGVFHCEVMEPMEFSRFTPAANIGIGEPNSPLVIAISAGGGTARISEILDKANALGALSMVLTNKQGSRATEHAKKTFFLDTPAMENDFPGLRSYFASMIGLISLACRMGRVKNILPPTAPEAFRRAISEYVHSFGPVMEKIDTQMFELAKKWKDFERFNFIGSGAELYSALFSLEKFYECTGVVSNYDDAEDWCHIDYYLKTPENIGTVVYADKNAPDFSRTKETICAACGIHRPTLVITNAHEGEFPKEASICRIPEAPKGFEWLMPLMDYAPAALLAGYCCTLAGRKFFNEYDPIAKAYNGGGIFFNKNIMTMSTSKIEVHI